eukprot:5870600-Amphidinium_carterae.1
MHLLAGLTCSTHASKVLHYGTAECHATALFTFLLDMLLAKESWNLQLGIKGLGNFAIENEVFDFAEWLQACSSSWQAALRDIPWNFPSRTKHCGLRPVTCQASQDTDASWCSPLRDHSDCRVQSRMPPHRQLACPSPTQ